MVYLNILEKTVLPFAYPDLGLTLSDNVVLLPPSTSWIHLDLLGGIYGSGARNIFPVMLHIGYRFLKNLKEKSV